MAEELNETQETSGEPGGKEQKEHKSRSGLWLSIIIVLLLIGLAGFGYLLLQDLRAKQEDIGGEIVKEEQHYMELTRQITGYQTQLTALQSQLATLNAKLTGKENQINKNLAELSSLYKEKLENMRKEQKQAIQKIQRQLGKTRGDWLLTDAEYLLSVANQRLHLVGDVRTTLEALEAADQRLRESGDAAAFKVREQLAKEITLLKGVEVPDIVGIYAVLQTLEDNIDKLSLQLPFAGKPIKQPEIKDNEPSEDSEAGGILDSAIKELEGIVTIRHLEKPVEEILTAQEARFIKQQLRVKLEMVKFSLVQQHDRLYRLNLADAKKWLQENFDSNDNARKFLAKLEKLQNTAIHSQLPDISKSLKMLRDITKLRIETDKALQDIGEPAEPQTSKPEAAAPATTGELEAAAPAENSKEESAPDIAASPVNAPETAAPATPSMP